MRCRKTTFVRSWRSVWSLHSVLRTTWPHCKALGAVQKLFNRPMTTVWWQLIWRPLFRVPPFRASPLPCNLTDTTATKFTHNLAIGDTYHNDVIDVLCCPASWCFIAFSLAPVLSLWNQNPTLLALLEDSYPNKIMLDDLDIGAPLGLCAPLKLNQVSGAKPRGSKGASAPLGSPVVGVSSADTFILKTQTSAYTRILTRHL